MNELKPCPFCGSEAHIFEFLNGYGIKCNQCNGCMSADMYQGYKETIRMWNKRVCDENNIPHSCEYCIHCCCNNWYYCDAKEEVRNVTEETIKRKNKCKEYEGCATSVITMEEYKPRGYTKPIPEWMKL